MARDQYQTVQEIAERLKISEATVRGWIRDGQLRAIEIGKVLRIADRDMNQFLVGHATRVREREPGVAGSNSSPDTPRESA